MTGFRFNIEHDNDIYCGNTVAKLSRIFCRNQSPIDDTNFKYVMLCNKTWPDSTSVIAQWMALINWEAVMCFDPNYGADSSLYNELLRTKDFLR